MHDIQEISHVTSGFLKKKKKGAFQSALKFSMTSQIRKNVIGSTSILTRNIRLHNLSGVFRACDDVCNIPETLLCRLGQALGTSARSSFLRGYFDVKGNR